MKHVCSMCGRKAVFTAPGGRVKADDDHDLCPKCYRALMAAAKASDAA